MCIRDSYCIASVSSCLHPYSSAALKAGSRNVFQEPLIAESGRALHVSTGQAGTRPEWFLVRQCWTIENEWHWVRDVQLGEDAHRYPHRVGAPLFSFLRTVVMNLLRRAGFRSIHAGQQELAHDISRMLMLGSMRATQPDF